MRPSGAGLPQPCLSLTWGSLASGQAQTTSPHSCGCGWGLGQGQSPLPTPSQGTRVSPSTGRIPGALSQEKEEEWSCLP